MFKWLILKRMVNSFSFRNVIVGVAQFRAAGKQYCIRNRRQISQSTDDVDRISTGSGASLDSQNQLHNRNLNTKTSPTITAINPQGGNSASLAYTNGKSQSDSESVSVATTSVPTRISSSSDIGYGSMTEQKPPSDTDVDDREVDEADISQQLNQKSAKTAKFWGQMGRSLDQWVQSGMKGLANVASYAAETSYYSPAFLMISGYPPDYASRRQGDYDDDDDDFDENDGLRNINRRLNFEDELEDGKSTNTLRLLRSVSFGNDTQIMSKLKELKEDLIAEDNKKQLLINSASAVDVISRAPVPTQDNGVKRSSSAGSNASLEGKVNQFYEPSVQRASVETPANSREETPVDGDEEDLLKPNSLNPPRSPSLQIRNGSKDVSREATPCSPARTPVTQNDPLGALSDPCSPVDHKIISKKFPVVAVHPGGSSVNDLRMDRVSNDSPKRTCSEGQISGVCEVHPDNSNVSKAFHRSSTLPNYSTITGISGGAGGSELMEDKYANGALTPVVPSLSAISSSLKNPFG